MELNKKVADFTLKTDEDKDASLSDYAGKPVVLFFYPRADTPGCTIEACGFRDTFKSFRMPAPWCSASPGIRRTRRPNSGPSMTSLHTPC